MAKAKKTKSAKRSKPSKRANKYEEKVKVDATFEQLLDAVINPKKKIEKKDK
jgi:hypothetical protein